MATSLLKFSFKTGLVKSIISEISSNISKYYYAFGKSDPWFSITGLTATLVANSNTVVLTNGYTTSGFIQGQSVTQSGGSGSFGVSTKIETIVSATTFTVTVAHAVSGGVVFSIDDESVVQPAIDSYEYDTQVRNNSLVYKQVDVNDVAPVILRQDWQSGYVFDMYREYTEADPSFNGATALESSLYYVLTDEYRVYKCLDNYNNSPSVNKPTSTSPAPFQTDDSYIWKYMYTIPVTLRNKFLSNTLMPVTTSLTNQFYSKGAIVGYSIADPGAKYVNGSYKVTGFRILKGGSYTGTPAITIQAPHQSGGTQAVVGTITLTSNAITAISMSSVGSGYTYPPTFIISGSGGAEIEPIIALVNAGGRYTNLEVVGDGNLEENPYVLGSFEITNGGTGYESITLLFTNPDLPNGVRAVATVTINPSSGAATGIVITQEGYGYSNKFKSIMEDPTSVNVIRYTQTNKAGMTGTGFSFRVTTKKNEAVLNAIVNSDGQIQEIKVSKPGIGYTYASCNVVTDFDTTQQTGFKPASILLDFGIGSIQTNQSTVEITAVPGAIYAIHIKDPGADYSTTTAPTISIVGDGTGAEAEAVIDAYGKLQKVKIISPGSGYTVASATVVGPSTKTAEIDVVLPPKNGHGSDAISELYAKTIMFRTSLFKDTIDKQSIVNSFRQVSLVKNPRNYGSNTNLRLGIATSCILAIGSKSQSVDFNKIYVNDILLNNENRFLVVAKYPNYSTTNYAILLNYLDNTVFGAGSTLTKPSVAGNGANFSVSETIAPTVNKYSGEMLTLDNRIKFSPSVDQIVVASNTITF